ncbi:MAG: hypothetical protein RhofKO_20780 [Rhodothermales bacterium]
MIQLHKFSRVALLGLLSVVLLTSCEESVDPILDANVPFTLYGYLNPKSDTQSIRVFPIEEEFDTRTERPIDATVTSTNLTVGGTQTWTGNSVFFPENGTYGHVFNAAFTPQYGHAYRIEVLRSDGATSSVEVSVPPAITSVFAQPPRTVINTQLSRPAVEQDVRFESTFSSFLDVTLTYYTRVKRTGPDGFNFFSKDTLSLAYQDRIAQAGNAWDMTVTLSEDRFTLVELLENRQAIDDENDCIIVERMEASLFVANEAWTPPNGRFDINEIIQPGTFSNVENGFGFVGAGYSELYRWRTPEPEMQLASMLYDDIPNGTLRWSPDCSP